MCAWVSTVPGRGGSTARRARFRARWTTPYDWARDHHDVGRLDVAVRHALAGPGVAQATNLFVPFFTTKQGRSGIGLAVVRQIAEGHRGHLAIETRADGKGAAAIVDLPRGNPPVQASREKASPLSAGDWADKGASSTSHAAALGFDSCTRSSSW
jgi:hypothetical protein